MKFKVPWSLLSESVVHFLYRFFSFYKYDYKECPLTAFEEFSKRSFGEICTKRLTTSVYMNLNFNNICLYGLGK